MNEKIFHTNGKTIRCRVNIYVLKMLSVQDYSIEDIWFASTNTSPALLKDEILKEEFKVFLSQIPHLDQSDIEELYIRGLGELQIDICALEQMTPQELDSAYEGYLRKQELSANLIKTAILQSMHNDTSYIELNQQRVTKGELAERSLIFSRLGIKEEKNGRL